MTEGRVGDVPMWYRLIRASQYLGVAPWDLASAPITWLHRAEAAQVAEAAADKARQARQRH